MYCQYKVVKEIWDALTKKYIVEDVGTQKYSIGNFRKFQMTEDRDVSSQIHDYHMLINDLVTEDIKLPKPFIVGYLIETLPYSWKDYKNSMKHKRKQMSLEDVIIHIRIEEQNKTRYKAARAKDLSSKENVVEERPRPQFNKPKGQNPRLSLTHQTRSKILPLKIEIITLSVENLDTMHLHLSVATERDLRKSTQGKIW